jgi:hypothetical protein
MVIIPTPCVERPVASSSRFKVALIDDFRLSSFGGKSAAVSFAICERKGSAPCLLWDILSREALALVSVNCAYRCFNRSLSALSE